MPISDGPKWHRYLRFWRTNISADVEAEIAFHVDARTEELIASGLDEPDAHRQALREFGDVERARSTLRAMDEHHYHQHARTEPFVDLWKDVRIAMRSLARSPGFVTVVALTLALGIGLNSAVFSIVDAYLFRPIDVPAGKDLIVVGRTEPALPAPHELSYPDYLELKRDTATFSGLLAYAANNMSLAGGKGAERIWTQETTGNFFSVLGVKPLIGRLYQEGDDQGELAHPIIVLTYDFWQSHFAGDPNVIGDTIRLNNHPITIIGVTPPGFYGVDGLLRMQGFTPINQTWPSYGRTLLDRGASSFNVMGTLHRGVSLATAANIVTAKAKALEREFPETNRGVGAVVLRETHTRPNVTVSANVPTIAAAFMGLVLLVLAVACANVTSLLLARATSQFREHAVRAALGASQWRLARRVLIECVLLAAAGSLGAILLAAGAVRAIDNVRLAADVPIHWTVRLDARVTAFTFGIALITAIVASLAPVLGMRRINLADVLKSGTRGSTTGRQRLRTALVVIQLSVCVAIVVCAGLFARSTRNATRMNVGFRTDNIVMATASLGTSGYDSARVKQFQADVIRKLSTIPGVRSAALARYTPFGYNNDIVYVQPELVMTKLPENGFGCFNNVVSPEYFATMQIPIIEGRGFHDTDNETSPKVAVVTQRFAAQLWPGTSAIGKRFRMGKDGPMAEVVGVSGDVQYFSLGETPKPFFFRPYRQWPRSQFTVNVQTTVRAESILPALRSAFTALDPNVPIFDVRTMTDHIENGRALLGTRLGAAFAAVFGVLALLLASIGLYGLMSYSVAQRTRELGIRVALGARTGGVLRLVLRQGLTVIAIGIVIGTLATLGITGLLSKLLYGVAPRDPATFLGVAVTLAGAGFVASIVPALRATRVDPIAALRGE